jgi:hypothetical protein
LLIEAVLKWMPAEVIVVADSDPPGQGGAENLARQLVAYVPAVRLIMPPAGIKDARGWTLAGATTGDVLAAIDAVPVRRLNITLMARGSK